MAIELPEALNLTEQMDGELKGKSIVSAEMTEACDSLRSQGFVNVPAQEFVDAVTGTTIAGVVSAGKCIYVRLEGGSIVALSLETSGRILFHPADAPPTERYNVRLNFADVSCLTVRIIGWGFAQLHTDESLRGHRFLDPEKQGGSPLDAEQFTLEHFCGILDALDGKLIKHILTRQKHIGGLANGLVQEVLFKAKIHPKRKARDISPDERALLYQVMTDTVREVRRLGGRDSEVDLHGQPGRYHVAMGGHLKNRPCPECGTMVEGQHILGSRSYVCPSCQT